MANSETPRDDQANQAPQPRQAEWGVSYPLFEDASALRNALAHINDFDHLGLDYAMDIEGYGSSHFPEVATLFRLPDGTNVNVYTHSETFDHIKSETEPSERNAPWGAQIEAEFTEAGHLVVRQFPLLLSADWRGPITGRNVTATMSANGKDELFNAVGWDYLEDEQEFVGGLQPARVSRDDVAATLIPGSDEFVSGMSIIFHEPKPVEP